MRDRYIRFLVLGKNFWQSINHMGFRVLTLFELNNFLFILPDATLSWHKISSYGCYASILP